MLRSVRTSRADRCACATSPRSRPRTACRYELAATENPPPSGAPAQGSEEGSANACSCQCTCICMRRETASCHHGRGLWRPPLGACGTRSTKVVDVASVCHARRRLPPLLGETPARRHNPISLAVANPVRRGAETSSPAETIGRPIGEAAAGLDRPPRQGPYPSERSLGRAVAFPYRGGHGAGVAGGWRWSQT
jgi:hypothetical protein